MAFSFVSPMKKRYPNAMSSPNCKFLPYSWAVFWYVDNRSSLIGSGVFATNALIPFLAMKSIPRGLPLTSGCQMSTG